MEPTLSDIGAAATRIARHIHRTPVLTCASLDRQTGAKLFFKCENLQKAGAFKIRGATNAVFQLPDTCKAVATHSSGNHAAALALAASWRGIKAHIVMPENSPAVKQDAVRSYGGQITLCASNLQAREETLARVVRQTGATFIPPYNDYQIIAGQGTAALELLEEIPELDLILAPVGGGGLLAGTAITTRALSPHTQVFGAEPSGADDAFRSFEAGHIIPMKNPITIADGLRTSLGEKTFPIIKRLAAGILTVREAMILEAMLLLSERAKTVVEPSGSVPLGVVLQHPQQFRNKRVGVILSGGNFDVRQYWMAVERIQPPPTQETLDKKKST